MIKPPQSAFVRKFFYWLESKILFPFYFKKVVIKGVPIKEGHSILLLQNHLSWWDGFWGNYLTYHLMKRKYHVMVQEDQLIKQPWLKHKGAFSVRKNSRGMLESIHFAADLLKDSQNLVLIFPQGKLQSMHAQEIDIQKGVFRLISQLDRPCQVIYNAVTIDYLESFKPTITFNLLDCGDACVITPNELREQINVFHEQTLKNVVRQ
ncbi:MAG: 1-acyl-sn-glycerol-3-phosphate acyltransferase [Cyclobacteriaceae bacterium]|jgi:1-acyl-sn-glycerol-3-phosphate acyltransferase